jgi:DNA-binding CsgD family transcriptional regulator/tetratricopeptide (TPR) repeat protein
MTGTPYALVGRDRELRELESLLAAARAGLPRFALISGEPGIGKSSLLDELASRAGSAGCLVLEGRATELERDFPFGLIVDALDGYLASLDARSFDRLGAEELGELASVFPALRSLRGAGSGVGTAAERFRALFAARELLERLAAPRPLLLALDDVHWSDDASVEFLAHLLRRPPDAAVMLAATIRSGRAPRTLAAAIEQATRRGAVSQVVLQPLDRDDAARLVTDIPPTQLERLYEESGGNPLFLLQLARARRGLTPRSSEPGWVGAEEVPAALRTAIAAELDELPLHARRLAQAAAVVGDPFEFDLAVATAAMTPADALASLDELVSRGVLRPGDAPRRFRFRHPLVRNAIYVTCPAGTRLVCHERAAAALDAQGAPPMARAHHVVHSARYGDAAAAALLRDAGFEASQRAPASAAMWFEAGIAILPSATPPYERVGLLMALAGAYAATGRLEDCRNALVSALGLAAQADPTVKMRLTSACAKIELLLGRHEAGQALLLRALEDASGSDPAISARLMIELASSAFLAGDFEGVRDWASRALAAAERQEDSGLIAGALAVLVLAESSEGPVWDAQAHCSRAAALTDGMSDEELAADLDALANLCGAEFQLQRYSQAETHAERGLALARLTARGDLFPWLSQVLTGVLYATGRLAEAAAMLDGLVEAARLTDNALGLASALVNTAAVLLAAGDVDAALAAAQEAAQVTRGTAPSVVAAWAGGYVGAALVEAGQPERAAEAMIEAGGGDTLPLIPGAFRLGFLEFLTRARLASGDRAGARRTAEVARQCAEKFDLGASNGMADLAEAAVALEDGNAGYAAERALAAAEQADLVGARLMVGAAQLLAGRALAGLGETERAAAELELARSTLAACGARRYLAAAERELRRLGRPVHYRSLPGKPEGTGVASLTGRELEIARLVVDRRTNPEIAAELFLSIKTVETHMRNIFRKLDADSRVEVARIIERDQAAARETP